MTEPTQPHDSIVDAIMHSAGRATLPFQALEENDRHGTAFWYNHLVEDTAKHEVIVQYLVTAEALTGMDAARWILRDDLCDPGMSARNLVMTDFAHRWVRLGSLGIAVMPTAELYAYADRKGWRWTTDEITDGLAAGEPDIATFGADPVPAYALGHDVSPDGETRDQAVAPGAVAVDPDGVLRWDRGMPAGFAGAPVFAGVPIEEGRGKLICAGVVLPGEERNEIVPFDRIRHAVAALPVSRASRPGRRWWRR